MIYAGFEISLTTLPILLTAGLGFYLTTLIYPGTFFLFIVYEAVAMVFALCAYIFLAIQEDHARRLVDGSRNPCQYHRSRDPGKQIGCFDIHLAV